MPVVKHGRHINEKHGASAAENPATESRKNC